VTSALPSKTKMMSTSAPCSPPKLRAAHTQIPLRAFQPAYASWTTAASDATTISDDRAIDRKPQHVTKRRFALRAPTSAELLLRVLHRVTGHAEPPAHELHAPEIGSLVRVLGWRQVSTSNGGAHLVYTILAAAPAQILGEKSAELSEARLVMRRYRDFVKLHAVLAPHARRAGISLPALPSKLTAFGRRLSPEVGAQRQKALHEWLSLVAGYPALLCDELRVFLGLSPHMYGATEAKLTSECGHMEAGDSSKMDVESHGYASEGTADVEEGAFAVDLAELEAKAVEVMLDDELWGR